MLPGRRTFILGCTAALVSPLTTGIRARQDEPITWERAVDAYLEGDLELAVRVLASRRETMAEDAAGRLGAWAGGESHFSGEGRRLAVRRLQASAALALEIPQPLTAQGRSGSALLLESVAVTAVKILKSREQPGMATPADSEGRTPDEIRRRMALFRNRWSVAYLQALVNDRRLSEAIAVAEGITLPDGDRALPEAQYLRGLIFETTSRMLPASKTSREDELLPPSRVPWINGQLGDAAGWYRRALDASQSHQEARLHLGRVELERGRHLRVLEILQPLRELQGDTWIGGLAWLFTGASYVALGSLDDARRAFDRAAQVPEVWQSGRVSLMQLALQRGDLAGAADTSLQFATPRALDTDNPPDAWLVYVSGRRPDDNAVLEPMRGAILP